jgi:type IV pilus assembly protein PilC
MVEENMARYEYQARDGSGMLATGVVAAASTEEASQLLRKDGKYIVKLAQVDDYDGDGDGMTLKQHARRVKRQDVIFLAHQLSIMIDTGVPISEALETVAAQSSNISFGEVMKDVTSQVQSGNDFSTALKAHPNVFPTVMTSLIHAAEVSGRLGQMLEKISEYMAKEEKTVKQVKGALMYPAFMVLMTVSVTVFLLAFVLPQFAGIYANRGATLPAPTKLLLSMSSTLIDNWALFLAGSVGSIVGFIMMKRTEGGSRFLDWLKLNVPLFKNLFTQLYVTRSCRTLGAMINAGVPMLDAVAITREVTANKYFEELWDAVDDNLRQGMQLSDPLFQSDLVPKSITQMIRSGEKSGRLGQVLSKIALFTEDEFDRAVKNMTQFIEPVMIVVMGGMIGFVAISLLLPIFNAGQVVAGT